MTYENVVPGVFQSRPDRFIANVGIGGKIEVCHVKNTGRCRELLVPGAPVWCQERESPARRTRFDLIAVQKGDRLINMDSAAPNQVFGEYLRSGLLLPAPTLVRPEVRSGNSRLDFYVENADVRAFCEVKGVTLEENGVAMFPDAPTQRGIKHLHELIQCVKAGFSAYAVFIIQMSPVRYFTPNRAAHPEFADALKTARDAGVRLLALDCVVTPESVAIGGEVKILL